MSDHHLPDDPLADGDDEEWGPSKTAEKREAHAAQKLGESLIELDSDALDQLPVSERMRDAISTARRIRARGARKRHMQYIGRLMREEDVEGIQAGLRRMDPNSPENQRLFQLAERWREALIEDPDAVTRFVAQFPQVDVQHLRQLQRAARSEAAREETGRASRALFQEVRAMLETAEPQQDNQSGREE